MKRKRGRVSSIVPSVVFGATFVGVVPFCVVAEGCGSSGGGKVVDSGSDTQFLGVGCIGFDGGGCGAVAIDAFTVVDTGGSDALGVFVAFDAGADVDAAAADAGPEAADGGSD